jgi:hypothetical protein
MKSPGNILFQYGKHKEGYWNYLIFSQQMEDMLDPHQNLLRMLVLSKLANKLGLESDKYNTEVEKGKEVVCGICRST